MMKQIVARGEPIPAALLAPLLDSSQLLREADPTRLQQRFHEQGYLFVKQFFDRDDIMAARQEILQRLVEVGEIAEPALEGIFTGVSQRREQVADLGKFWKSVSETWSLRRLSHSAALHDLMSTLLGGAAQAQDYLFLRPATPGKSTRIHCDYPFFTRATEAVASARQRDELRLHVGVLQRLVHPLAVADVHRRSCGSASASHEPGLCAGLVQVGPDWGAGGAPP